jgi:hypothetical protein
LQLIFFDSYVARTEGYLKTTGSKLSTRMTYDVSASLLLRRLAAELCFYCASVDEIMIAR